MRMSVWKRRRISVGVMSILLGLITGRSVGVVMVPCLVEKVASLPDASRALSWKSMGDGVNGVGGSLFFLGGRFLGWVWWWLVGLDDLDGVEDFVEDGDGGEAGHVAGFWVVGVGHVFDFGSEASEAAVGEDAVVDVGADGVGDDLDVGFVEAESGEAEAGGDVDVFWELFDGVAGVAVVDDGAFVDFDAKGFWWFGGDEGDAVELVHAGGEDAVDAADGAGGQVDAAVVFSGGVFESFEEVCVEEAADAHDDEVFVGGENDLGVLVDGFLGGGFEDDGDMGEDVWEGGSDLGFFTFSMQFLGGGGVFVEKINSVDAGHLVCCECDVGADGAAAEDSEVHRRKPKP